MSVLSWNLNNGFKYQVLISLDSCYLPVVVFIF